MTHLVIVSNHLGDTILRATPFMNHFGPEPFVIIALPHIAPLFEDYPYCDKLIVRIKKPWKAHLLEEWQKTKRTSWGTIFDFKASFFPQFLKAKRLFVWKRDSAQLGVLQRKYLYGSRPHVLLQVARAFGTEKPMDPVVWISEARLARLKPSRPTLAVAPIPGWVGKQWPMDQFIALLTLFCRTYPEAQVAVFAAPHEGERMASLLKALPQEQCVNMVGRHLLDSAALIQGSRVFLGNDSGLMHLSVAVKTPTIGLFGPSDERTHGPWSRETDSPHRVVRGAPFIKHIRQSKRDTNCYMTSITVPQVWEVLQERWEAFK